MSAALTSSLAVSYEDVAVAAIFADAAWLHALLRTEVAFARAEALAGVIPATAAAAISKRAETFSPDLAKLASATARDGFPILGLVEQLRAHVGPDAAGFVHWGATTQDILDTALVAQLNAALVLIEEKLACVTAALAALADRHRRTLMVGRTHMQPALPTTFGLTAANWLAPLVRHRRRLEELRPRLLVVQCGGAAGTLASLGDKGPAVAAAFAAELGLGVSPMPWHAQRDTILEVAGFLSLVAGSVAKFGQDVLLLSQMEVGELRESGDLSKGGSSAMPQKSNPVTCENILIAAHSAEAHHAALGFAPLPEHQRGTTTWQLEFLHLPRLCALTAGTLRAAEYLVSNLVVDSQRMRINLQATQGVILAEAIALALREHMPADDARSLVREACVLALERKRRVIDILRVRTNAPINWDRLDDENNHLGSADRFIDEVLADAAKVFPCAKSSP